MKHRLAPLGVVSAMAAALAACGPSDNDPGPGGVTVGEARALDEAAEMIDERRTPAEILADGDATGAATAQDAGDGAPARGDEDQNDE